MKIAFIGQKGIFGKSGGGVESHVEDLALYLVKEGHEVIVYVRPYYCRFKFSKTRTHRGITLITLPTIKTKHLDAITHTFFASFDVLRRDVDIVHYHMIGPAFLLWIPKLFKRKARVVFTFHSQDYHHKKWGKFAQFCLYAGEWIGCHIADEVIAVSKNIKKYIYEKYGIMASFIPNGVKPPPVVRSDFIKKLGLQQGEYILCVARMVPHKNIHLLVSAYNRLRTQGFRKKLVIVGGGAYTDLYTQYVMSHSKKNKNIIFTGQLPNNSKLLRELYHNAYLYVHPSESEGLSVSILEAGSFGIPVLASDIIENRDVLKNDGFYFRNKDVIDLRNKLSYLLQHRKVLLSKKDGFRQVIHSMYNWKDLVKKISRVYYAANRKH